VRVRGGNGWRLFDNDWSPAVTGRRTARRQEAPGRIRRRWLFRSSTGQAARQTHFHLWIDVSITNNHLSPVRENSRVNIAPMVFFTARCAIVQSAVLRSHVVCPSVCDAGGSSDHDHVGWKSWKLISPTSSLFLAQRSSTYSQGNMEKFWGENIRS